MTEEIDKTLKKLVDELETSYNQDTYKRTHRRVRVLSPLLKKLARRHSAESEAHFRQVTKKLLASELAFPGGKEKGVHRKKKSPKKRGR